MRKPTGVLLILAFRHGWTVAATRFFTGDNELMIQDSNGMTCMFKIGKKKSIKKRVGWQLGFELHMVFNGALRFL